MRQSKILLGWIPSHDSAALLGEGGTDGSASNRVGGRRDRVPGEGVGHRRRGNAKQSKGAAGVELRDEGVGRGRR